MKEEKQVIWDAPPEFKEDQFKDLKIAWAMPAYGPVYPEVYANHIACVAYASRYMKMHQIGDMPIVGVTDKMYTHTASNKIVRGLLESDCTHVFWTENDMLLPFYVIPKLLSHDKDICTGVYFLRKGGGQPCLYLKGPTPVHTHVSGVIPVSIFPEDSLFKVHCAGMGCALIKREVFERIPPPWFDLKEGFKQMDHADVIYGYGQDIYFYHKVSEAGIDVWVDSSIHSSQVMDVHVNIHDYRAMIKNPDFVVRGAVIGSSEAKKGAMEGAGVP